MATVDDTRIKKRGGPRKYKTCKCGFVGYGTKVFPSQAKGMCSTCWKESQTAKRLRNNAPCKVCGKLTPNNKGHVTCSLECSKVHNQRSKIEKRMEVSCCVCGKSVVKYKNELKTRDRFACSLECQRRLINSAGDTDWLRRSKQAKELYKRKSSRERRSKNEWFAEISRSLSNCKQDLTDYDSWEYRIRSRLNAHSGRSTRRKNHYVCSSSVEQALARTVQKRKYFELSDWEKKIGFKLSSHKSRRNRKNVNKKARASFEKAHEGICYPEEDRKQRIQMCFEWLAD